MGLSVCFLTFVFRFPALLLSGSRYTFTYLNIFSLVSEAHKNSCIYNAQYVGVFKPLSRCVYTNYTTSSYPPLIIWRHSLQRKWEVHQPKYVYLYGVFSWKHKNKKRQDHFLDYTSTLGDLFATTHSNWRAYYLSQCSQSNRMWARCSGATKNSQIFKIP